MRHRFRTAHLASDTSAIPKGEIGSRVEMRGKCVSLQVSLSYKCMKYERSQEKKTEVNSIYLLE